MICDFAPYLICNIGHDISKSSMVALQLFCTNKQSRFFREIYCSLTNKSDYFYYILAVSHLNDAIVTLILVLIPISLS